MRNFTLRKGFLEHRFGTRSSFKSFVVLVVIMIMTTSSAMAEVIDGLRYNLDSDTKTATLLSKTNDTYSGDIVVPEKIKSSDGVEYSVTSLGAYCFEGCSGLETFYFKGKVPKSASGAFIPTTCVYQSPNRISPGL